MSLADAASRSRRRAVIVLFYRAQSLQNSRWPQSMSFSGQLGEATDILLVAWFVALPRAIVSTIG